jgi:hypothetical protein
LVACAAAHFVRNSGLPLMAIIKHGMPGKICRRIYWSRFYCRFAILVSSYYVIHAIVLPISQIIIFFQVLAISRQYFHDLPAPQFLLSYSVILDDSIDADWLDLSRAGRMPQMPSTALFYRTFIASVDLVFARSASSLPHTV